MGFGKLCLLMQTFCSKVKNAMSGVAHDLRCLIYCFRKQISQVTYAYHTYILLLLLLFFKSHRSTLLSLSR